MESTDLEEKLARVPLSDRVLLLSHCLRPSQSCPGKFSKQGLNCPDDCAENCVIRRTKERALKLGYKGVCIAAGGAMALRFVKEQKPQGIVAVACQRELGEGIEGVKKISQELEQLPAIMVIPLTSDGCVDTEVDEDKVLQALSADQSGNSSK